MTQRPATVAYQTPAPSTAQPSETRISDVAPAQRARGTERYAGYVPDRVLSHGPDGTSISATNAAEQAVVELRFIAAAKQQPHRWDRLCKHIAALDMLNHPSVRKVLEHDLDGDEPVLVLVRAPGMTLAQTIAEDGALDPLIVAQITERLAGALASAHRLQIIHGKLHPQAVWLENNGLPWIELSGTNVLGDALTSWDRACRAPEYLRTEPDAASDVFALAMIALGALVGGDPTEGAGRITAGGVIEGLRVILSQALQKDPDDRPTAMQLQQLLREWIQSNRHSGAPSTSNKITAALAAEFEAPSPGAAKIELREGAQLGRYYLLRRLGEGGMGEVWEGMDLSSSTSVALKMLRPQIAADPVFLRRFRKEARTLAAVRNPYIANLVEINEDRGMHYLAMEFVEGTSVANVLEQITIFDEREALTIIADACRALAEPHRTGVVHRDIKPDNMMFVRANEPLKGGDEGRQRIKVCDFGIARQEEGSDATQMTQEGMLLGTPAYMSPEQCKGQVKVSPTSDVYSLGATLYELLTGQLLFDADTPMGLVVQHINETPKKINTVNAKVSDATTALIERMLQKNPADRYADAGALLEAVEGILHGKPAAIEVHPQLPEGKPGWTRKFVFEWELSATPEQLWPYISNTERMNRATGLASVKYEIRGISRGVSERKGSNSVLGFALKWQEMPYEWVENKRHSVLRVFEQGLLRWYSAEVELQRLPSGKTLLRNTVTIEPRGWLAYLLSPFEMGVKYKRALDKVYRRLDAILSNGAAALPVGTDLLQPDVKLASGAEQVFDRAIQKLTEAKVDRLVAEQLISYLRVASDQDVARIRPLEVAEKLKLPGELVAAACMQLAKEGVLVLLWDVLCPSCQIPSSLAESLQKVQSHGECATCNLEFALDFAKSVELIFRAAPSIRAVETQTFCLGGPGHFPHVIAQLRLAPGERFSLPLSLPVGTYRIRSAQLLSVRELRVQSTASLRRLDLHIGGENSGFEGTTTLTANEQMLALSNGLDQELVLRLERASDRSLALTAARASAMRAFRELFPEQVLAPGALVTVASMTLLCTALEDSAAMLRKLGDSAGTAAVLEHFRVINDVVSRHGGALLKTVGTSALAAFDTPAGAVEAAIEIRSALKEKPGLSEFKLRIAVHRGPMLAATVNDRLDYFGNHAELALALPQELSQPTTLLTQTVANDGEVEKVLKAKVVQSVPRKVHSAGLDAWGLEILATTA